MRSGIRTIARLALASFSVVFCALESPAKAENWPQFLGPNRDGTYPGKLFQNHSPEHAFPLSWKISVGEGFSGPVADQERVVIFHRLKNQERLECRALVDGHTVWESDASTAYRDDFGFDEGPRATPAIGQGCIVAMGAEGLTRCVELNTGKLVWSLDTQSVFGARKGFFGMASSPLIHGEAVFLTVGGQNGAGMVAASLKTGKILWKTLKDESGYASPTLMPKGDRSLLVNFTRSGLCAIDIETGNVLDQFRWRSRSHASVNAATPLVRGHEVFISASYETGAALVDFSKEKFACVWQADQTLSNHYATSVESDGLLYGFDGRQEQGPSLTCIEWRSGKPKWRKDGLGAGTLILASKTLLLLTERGELVLANATGTGFKKLGRSQILGNATRAHPALVDGRFLARDKHQMVCYDLR